MPSKQRFKGALVTSIEAVKRDVAAKRAKPRDRFAVADEALADEYPDTDGEATSQEPVTGQGQVTGQNVPRSPAQPVTRQEPVTGAQPVETVVKQRKGFLLIPNAIVWGLFPELGIYERGAYEELYLWTHGFGENPRRVNQTECYKRLRISERQWRRAVDELEKRGLVERLAAEVRGSNASRGTLIRVNVPAVASAEPTGSQPATGGQRVTGRKLVHESKKKVEEKGAPDAGAPADSSSILRKIAEQFRASRPGADAAAVRARVLEFVRQEGWPVDEAAIAAAVEGTAL